MHGAFPLFPIYWILNTQTWQILTEILDIIKCVFFLAHSYSLISIIYFFSVPDTLIVWLNTLVSHERLFSLLNMHLILKYLSTKKNKNKKALGILHPIYCGTKVLNKGDDVSTIDALFLLMNISNNFFMKNGAHIGGTKQPHAWLCSFMFHDSHPHPESYICLGMEITPCHYYINFFIHNLHLLQAHF